MGEGKKYFSIRLTQVYINRKMFGFFEGRP